MSQHTVLHSIKSEIKDNLSISIPLIASQMIYASSGFIGTAMIAHLGEDALAASVLVSTIWMSLSVLFFGLLNSISVLVSHQYGAKNQKAISEIMGQSFLLGILVSILIILLMLMVPFIMRYTDQPKIVLDLANRYMYSLLWTIPGLILLIIYEQFFAGINRAKIVLRISILVVPVEIPIIYILIFGKFGLPECGVAGIGYGFATTYTGTAIVLTFFLLKSTFYRQFQIFSKIYRINFFYLKELISIGLPMGFMHVIEVSTFAVVTFWIARFGTTLLAAHQIVMQYLGFVITLVFAMSQAVTVRVGLAVGRLDLRAIQYAAYVGMVLNSIAVIIIALAFYAIPRFFLSLDINTYAPHNASLVRYASSLLAICGVLMLFDNFRIIGFGALRGLKDTKFPMYAAFIAFWVIGLSSGFLFGFVLDYKAKGIWWGLTLGIACGAAIVLIRFYRLLKRVDLRKILTAA